MKSYRNIFTHADFKGPTVELLHAIREQRPTPDMIEELIGDEPHSGVLAAIANVRRVERSIRGENGGEYFRGSGIVVVGDDEKLLAADYQGHGNDEREAGDPVADKYGGYQHMALWKVVLGAYASRLGRGRLSIAGTYPSVNRMLAVRNLLPDGLTFHHIGYASDGIPTFPLVAGASGMLPSDDVADTIARREYNVLNRDRAAGLVDWPRDEFAGYHDLVAATSVLGTIIGDHTVLRVPPVNPLVANGVNLH
jgi:hypothetical protein